MFSFVFYFKRLKLSKQLPEETLSSRKTIAINDEDEQEMLDKSDKEAIAAIFSVTEENIRYTPPDDHLMPFVILLPFLFITLSSIRSGDSQEGAHLDHVYLSWMGRREEEQQQRLTHSKVNWMILAFNNIYKYS